MILVMISAESIQNTMSMNDSLNIIVNVKYRAIETQQNVFMTHSKIAFLAKSIFLLHSTKEYHGPEPA